MHGEGSAVPCEEQRGGEALTGSEWHCNGADCKAQHSNGIASLSKGNELLGTDEQCRARAKVSEASN
jgi:hypothetical protein